jgi:hypothetical protein
MKHTILMLVFFGAYFLTYLSLASIIFLFFSDLSFLDIMRNDGMLTFMLFVGWLPAGLVILDVEELFN